MSDQKVASESDARVVNNVDPDPMRFNYRVLSDMEKMQMHEVKSRGKAFHDLADAMGKSRELSMAKTKIEEAVMWAVKHITREVPLG